MKSLAIIMIFMAQYALADGFQGTWHVTSCKVNGTSECAGEQGATYSFNQIASNVPLTARISYEAIYSDGATNGLIFSTHTNNTSFQNVTSILSVNPNLTEFTWSYFYQGVGTNPHLQVEEQWTLKMADSKHASYIGEIKFNYEGRTSTTLKEIALSR